MQPCIDHILQICFVFKVYGLFVLPPFWHKGPLHFLGLFDEGPQISREWSWKGQRAGKWVSHKGYKVIPFWKHSLPQIASKELQAATSSSNRPTGRGATCHQVASHPLPAAILELSAIKERKLAGWERPDCFMGIRTEHKLERYRMFIGNSWIWI